MKRPLTGVAFRRGFALIETLLAVAIFALGVFTLGRCISQGLVAERQIVEEARARRVLENRFVEIEAGAVAKKDSDEKLSGACEGLTLKQHWEPLHKEDELGRELSNLFVVTLTVNWGGAGTLQTRTLTFYVRSSKS